MCIFNTEPDLILNHMQALIGISKSIFTWNMVGLCVADVNFGVVESGICYSIFCFLKTDNSSILHINSFIGSAPGNSSHRSAEKKVQYVYSVLMNSNQQLCSPRGEGDNSYLGSQQPSHGLKITRDRAVLLVQLSGWPTLATVFWKLLFTQC